MTENLLFNIETAKNHLSGLNPDTKPAWGIMTAQHMVEHLSEIIRFSNGKTAIGLAIPEDKAERAKTRMLTPEYRLPVDFKAAFLPENELPPLKYSSLENAKTALFSEIEDFYSFFAQNKDAMPTHPYFHNLNESEWELLHHKHFLHHFQQFGLV